MPIIRTLAPDPLRSRAVMVCDQREHPVVRTLRRRRETGSRPGARSDGRRVALVIEGGAMRGVVSAGMTAALEQLGLTKAFDEVHGASAGAFNAAFLLAGQAAYMTALYTRGFGDPRFVSIRRALRGGGPAFDMDALIEHVWSRLRPLRIEALLSSGIELHCTATDADRAEIVDLAELHDEAEVRCALRASARLPWLAGEPVSFRGQRLLDATIAEAIPVRAALQTATDVLVLQTRPVGVDHSPLSSPVAMLTDRYLRRVNPNLVELRRTRSERYDELSAWLGARAAESAAGESAANETAASETAGSETAGSETAASETAASETAGGEAVVPAPGGEASPAPAAICVIRPPAEATLIGQLEHNSHALTLAGSEGLRAAWMAIEGEDPEVLDVLRAYPSDGAARSSRT